MQNSCGEYYYSCKGKNTCPDSIRCGITWEEELIFPKQELIKTLKQKPWENEKIVGEEMSSL